MRMVDAEDRYLAEIVKDCEAVLGPGSSVLAIERHELDDGVELRARYRIDRWEAETTESGETVVDAHARLRAPPVRSDPPRVHDPGRGPLTLQFPPG